MPEDHHSHSEGHQTKAVGHDMHSMHSMSFHFGKSELILFNFWDVDSVTGLLISCAAIVGMCFLLEFVRWFRLYRTKQRLQKQPILSQSSRSQSIGSASPSVHQEYSHSPIVPIRKVDINLLCDGLLHAVQLTLGYMLMLVFMTFNVWLCATVVVAEVVARLTFSLFFPQLQFLNELVASTETCCG